MVLALRDVCRSCSVRPECILQGLTQYPTCGVWGGLGTRPLQKLRTMGVVSIRGEQFLLDRTTRTVTIEPSDKPLLTIDAARALLAELTAKRPAVA